MSALHTVRKYFPAVTDVEDATKHLHIEVSKADVKDSTVRNHNNCALATACKRKLKADGVIISVSRAYVIKGTKAIKYDIRESIAREIVAFDRDGKFQPGEYKLNRPAESHRLGRTARGPHKTAGHKRNGFVHRTEGIRTVLGSQEIS